MNPLRHALLPGLLLCLGGSASRLAAQAVALVVRDGLAGPPLPGAIVRLLRGDSTVARGLTSEAGRLTLRAPSVGRYFLQVSRIGYSPGARVPVDLVDGEARPVELTATWNQIVLPEISVEGRTSCGKPTEQRALAATLWDQIRQALTATSMSEQGGLTLNSRTVDRTLSASGTIREERASSARLTGSRPFVPVPPARLAEFGYVRADADSVEYSAPDAESLLADPFVETHCFGIRAGQKEDSLSVGLTFEPLKARHVADIRGVLWVDRHSLELRTLEFRYVSSNQSVLESSAWGRLEFAKLPSGAWYIRTWFIRMPQIERTVVKTTFRDVVIGFREHGGTAEAAGPKPPVLGATIRGRVTDSLAGGGLAGVVVSVAGAIEFAVTDSLGDYTLGVPVSGSRLVTFTHPLLAGDSLRTQRVVELTPGGSATAFTSTPGPELLLRMLCPVKDRGRAGLMGRVITETRGPAAGIVLRAEWSTAAGSGVLRRNEATLTNDAGLWSFCDLPSRASVTLRLGARRNAEPAGSVEIEESRFRWLTLVAPQSTESRVATIDSAQRLPEIRTTGKIPIPAPERFQAELRDRIQRNGAPGSALITRAELERSGKFRLASLLVVHGLKERVNKYGKQTLVCPRTADRPAIFVDGLLVDGSDSPSAKRFRAGMIGEVFDMENLSPEEVEAVEVYRSPGEWPAEFDRTQASCVVVIWLRRGGKEP